MNRFPVCPVCPVFTKYAIYRPVNLKQCVECGACWNVCDYDAVDFSEPKGGTGVRFSYG